MKIKNYEKFQLLYISIIVLIIIECIFFIILEKYKMEIYQTIPAIVVDQNTLVITIIKKEKQLLYKGNYIYIDNKKIKYKIIKDNKYTIDKENYCELTIYLDKRISKKEKDIVTITILKEKEKSIKIFQKIKDGG